MTAMERMNSGQAARYTSKMGRVGYEVGEGTGRRTGMS